MTVALRGIFLTSDKPAQIARFYREVALLNLEQVGSDDQYHYWKLDSHGMQLAIHDARLFAPYTHPGCAESNVTHLYFKIENYAEFHQHLVDSGATVYSTDDVVITVIDPDGRKVLFGTA